MNSNPYLPNPQKHSRIDLQIQCKEYQILYENRSLNPISTTLLIFSLYPFPDKIESTSCQPHSPTLTKAESTIQSYCE